MRRSWVVVLVLVAACGNGSPAAGPAATPSPTSEQTVTPVPTVEVATATPAAPTATATPTATPVPPTAVPTTGLDLGLDPATVTGIVTSAGIPVAVLAQTPDGYLVRSPCGATVEVGGGTPIGPVDVVLDAGHGGPIDTGAVGPNGLIERDLNLRLAFATEAVLEERGIAVAQTRVADYLLPLDVRASFADDLEATILVSIHHNAPVANPSDTPGTEVFVQTDSPESARLGGLLFEEVKRALSVFDIAWTTAPDAGVLRVLLPDDGGDAYGMIRRPVTPTALVELGYLANGPEAELFATDEYIDVAADAVADAIEAYLETDRPGDGFGNPPRVFRPAFAPGRDVCDDPVLE